MDKYPIVTNAAIEQYYRRLTSGMRAPIPHKPHDLQYKGSHSKAVLSKGQPVSERTAPAGVIGLLIIGIEDVAQLMEPCEGRLTR